MFKIVADADALPSPVKEILFRASQRLSVPLILVASKIIQVPRSDLISTDVVSIGADSADDRIVELLCPGDLVITADIPLADRVLRRDCGAIDPRGVQYTPQNIKDRLSLRDLLHDLRNEGLIRGKGPAPFSNKSRQAFANMLDRFLTRRIAESK